MRSADQSCMNTESFVPTEKALVALVQSDLRKLMRSVDPAERARLREQINWRVAKITRLDEVSAPVPVNH
jgi:hypothetical protein